MMDKLTGFADYFRKIPAAFLVAIVSVLGLILFLPEQYAKTLASFHPETPCKKGLFHGL